MKSKKRQYNPLLIRVCAVGSAKLGFFIHNVDMLPNAIIVEVIDVLFANS